MFLLETNPCEALADGLNHDEIFKLASLGNGGLQPSHCSRDLVKSLTPYFKQLPKMATISIPIYDVKAEEQKDLSLDIQYPHDVFAYYSTRGAEFHQLFGTTEEIRSFWQSKDLRDPAFRSHPALQRADFNRLCVPLKLHSDGVVLSKHDSLHVISWASFFSQGNILEIQILFAALVKSAWVAGEGGTASVLYKHLKWSLEACLEGKHPTLDWDGQPFEQGSYRSQVAGQALHPENYFMAAFLICGDLEELCNQYGLRHFNSNQPCFWCSANVSDLPWSDLAPTALWRGTVVTEADAMRPSTHPLWQIPGFSVWSVGWDILHGLDLGPSSHVIGNILDDLVHLGTLGRNMEDRVKAIWSRAQEVYKQQKIQNRLAYLDLNRFRHPGDFPKMKCKANEARHFLPVLKELLLLDGTHSTYTATRARLLDSLLAFYSLVDSHNLVLSNQEAAQGRMHLLMFLTDYSILSRRAVDAGVLKWQMTIKFHYLAHAAEGLVWANPKFTSTYAGESYVGKISKIAVSAAMGKPSALLGGLLMSKVQAGRAVRLRQQMV